MDVGVGLPTTVRDVTGGAVLDWARRAETAGFASLGVLDRLVARNHEPVVALAAAAGATRRIRLATTILIAAYRDSAAVLAKQLASLDELAGGRLAVGVAAGGRPDDFEAAGTPYAHRGRRLDDMIAEMREIWTAARAPGRDRQDAGQDAGRDAGRGGIGPCPPGPGGPPIWVGGHSDAALRRAARLGQGWIAGGASALPYGELAARARAAWAAQGRTDEPRMVALAYFALGPHATDHANRHLRDYYARSGPYADRAVDQALVGEEDLRRALEQYEAAGCDELILFPCAHDLEQVDRLAAALPWNR